ncbi:sugar transporter [Shimia abyssi]|uniref:sugar transporter n=1 Tax=Shimia abyssi TaxID=1662395 RepID=UPI001FAEC7A1|nr:sugar transporter [Shimia abyssi]
MAAFYLWVVAEDQYASITGFTVRSEDGTSAIDVLGGLTQISGGGGASDADILYEFIQNQELVKAIDEKLDLRKIYGAPYPRDFVFGFDEKKPIEDLASHWRRMVRISYDSITGLIELRVHAFSANDAKNIAEAIVLESSRVINALSEQARRDATRYAEEDLGLAVERLKISRQAVTEFRSINQIADPTADIQVQMGLINTLQQSLADALVEISIVSETARASDPRMTQAERRIKAIRSLIAEERRKIGVGGTSAEGGDYAEVLGEFERLAVELEFSEQTYLAALTAYDIARAEARRKSRYLATYIQPTLAESSEYPQRLMLFVMVTFFGALTWAIFALVYYSIRDRR